MHTSRELTDRSFAITIDGRPAGCPDLFPGFDEHDRVGVVLAHPHGALGASLLYLAAVHAFYELCRRRAADFWIYPDFFFFHVGGRHGHHGSLDVWPDHKEVLVAADGDRLLEAVNDRAVTRLLVPEDLDIGRPRRREGLASYARRARGAFLYSRTGRVPGADVTIGGDDATARYVAHALDPAARAAQLGPGDIAGIIDAHRHEVAADVRERLRRERAGLVRGGREWGDLPAHHPGAGPRSFPARRHPVAGGAVHRVGIAWRAQDARPAVRGGST